MNKSVENGLLWGTIVCLALSWTAEASPVIYTLSGTGTGSLGPDPFSGASFTITSTADTSDITTVGSGAFWESVVSDLTATVFVSGLGTGTFTIPTINVDTFNQYGEAGIAASNQDAVILFNVNPAFTDYHLGTSLGPVTGTPLFNSDVGFGTTAGDFSLSSVSTVTFQVVVAPEPSTLALLVIASVGLVLRSRKHKP